ncbi:uncharacterized protein LOC133187320 [Saccostrea echinata]|uniref:uncharacterized protein LOC133187320 n=1 Tax=Saccostrea echinata TaxID=191078 RepID=UPI002A81823B|nr:uncharacterized protein LOC133187320 [Saccostrea echinata]
MTIAYWKISAVSTDAFVCNSEGYTVGSNKSVHTAVVYSVPLAVVIIILVVCLLYCRKKHNKKQKMEVESTAGIRQSSFQLVAKTDFYELVDNSNVSKLNPETEALDTVNTSETGISEKGIETSIPEKGIYDKAKNLNVSELTESVYNHLREGDTSVEQKENIYDRSTMLHDGRNSLYDFTTNKTNQKVSWDPTYDHAVPLDRLKN